ncbi:uncharacterized protein LOC122569596 isoform X2 [Bombus pyrosoma]|uniref:uncharacterized protein LOC122569596 isoform X2 n=1 Tax=Bombus pyrosoma TaxID=396416 RepID=UPI001CB97D15|nr:uncharacterized protein LOC122569596 isoform X2 [Bombus pyrosoma]XP_043586792.1 uncharacterized protein LOC122569596 isoform X2 [Bombus pyrosoma]XP_043586793.1 uncharacterized protein LOC122569596 isoform X2 [Bombus pyrosoma]XP_043586794.1 uncharacterized protein LOC122569596 isoform X2 [Bombus pyrosoma]XP_043586795.1 uncharacterized protein LOC122569596 isoform X2 [Bombus pyrosoma]XP_043586796.1 uncharacterized protein LOC122569596 isoform X2 [Bombus pyrosoma]
MLPSSRLLQDDPPELANATITSRTSTNGPTTQTTITVDDVQRNDDDPPPYSAIVPPNHVGWPYNFSGNRYSACNATSCRTDATPLAGFQPGLTSPGFGSHPRRTDGQHASISVPSMPCRLLMFGSRRSLFARESSTDNISIIKDTGGRTRKYGAILVGGAVIIFLMVLSLLVRFIMDKHLWRG